MKRRRALGAAICAAVALPAAAEEVVPLPGHADCLARAVAHFEMEFARSGPPDAREDWEIISRDRVEYCGTLAIVACDRGDAPQACQRALAADQRALRDRVLAGLPGPDELDAASDWAQGLYRTMHGVAHGSSAGPDCAGADDAYAAWCETRAASRKLAEAVALWQVARMVGAAGPAVEAGWVEAARYAPVPRPGRAGE